MARRRVTLAHVAHAAGVSRSQASNALSGSGRVSEATKQRVKQIADQLGYRPDLTARTLRTGIESMPLVGILLDPELQQTSKLPSHSFWSRARYSLLDSLVGTDVGLVVLRTEQVDDLNLVPINVAVLVSEYEPAELLGDLDLTVPLISLRPDCDDPRVRGYIYHDYRKIAVDVLDHLADQGATHVCIATYDVPQWWLSEIAAAATDWAAKSTVEIEVLNVPSGSSAEETSELIADAVRQGNDAIFDLLGNTETVLEGIRISGATCPDDVLLVSRMESMSSQLLRSPVVTALRLNSSDLGEVAVEVILGVLAGGADVRGVLSHELDIGQSSVRKSR